MEDLLRRLLKEYDEEKAFTTKEALFFKFLNTYRKASKSTGAKLGDFMMSNMKSFGLSPSEYQHYLNLYTQNYREDGRYDLTKKNELNQYHKLKSVKTSNQRAGDLVAELKPFKGNNLKANWEKDYKGDWAYVVYSWDWYPVFMYKYRRWFQVDDNYSSSTSKQMSQSHPARYNSSIGKTVFIVSRNEMKNLRDGHETTENVISNKNEKLIKTIEKQLNEYKQVRLGWDPRVRISYNFLGVDFVDDNPVIDVSVVYVDKMNGLKIDREAGDFRSGEMEGVTRDYIADLMSQYIQRYASSILGRNVVGDAVVNVTFD
jgi:hypothetical protein